MIDRVTLTFRKTGYRGFLFIPSDHRKNCVYISTRAGRWPFSHGDAAKMIEDSQADGRYDVSVELVESIPENLEELAASIA